MDSTLGKRNASYEIDPPSKKIKTDDDIIYEQFMASLNSNNNTKIGNPGEMDSLDEYMATLTSQENESNKKKEKEKEKVRFDIVNSDPMDAFIEQINSNDAVFLPSTKSNNEDMNDDYNSDDEVYRMAKYIDEKNKNEEEKTIKYDEYNNIVIPNKERIIESLQPIDHTRVFYNKFNKNFYQEHEEVSLMDQDSINSIYNKYNICVKGDNIPNPVISFSYFNFDSKLLNTISKQDFTEPTPIQMQSIPCILSGRDIIGLAKTGSGKTLSFIWPMITHIMDQDELEEGDGPIALIITPTRELAEQIFKEAYKYCKLYNLTICPLYGGMNMHQQKLQLKKGVEIIIATPGRLIEMIKTNVTNCFRITYLVIDEADRMFSLGFESQIRSIIGQIRPNRQVALFSATMNHKIKRLINDILVDPIHINIGQLNIGNEDIQQYLLIVNNDEDKWFWLNSNIYILLNNNNNNNNDNSNNNHPNSILIFCNSKKACEILHRKFSSINIVSGIIHGDKLQSDRTIIIDKFRNHKINILIATDVASRGLDIKGLNVVINYDVPNNMNLYIHRIGRTGRAGDKNGIAYTLINLSLEHDQFMSSKLVESLQQVNQIDHIPPQLHHLIKKNLPKSSSNNNNANNNSNNNDNKEKSKSKFGPGSHITGNSKVKKEAKEIARKTFFKNGFTTNNMDAAKRSFKNSFVAASSNQTLNSTKFNHSDSLTQFEQLPFHNTQELQQLEYQQQIESFNATFLTSTSSPTTNTTTTTTTTTTANANAKVPTTTTRRTRWGPK